MMTERARQIVDQKPTGWEYKLTAELFEAELRPIRAHFDDLRQGLVFASTKVMDGLEFMQFVQEQSRNLQVILHQPELILQNELMPAWGPAGIAGDAVAIERAVVRFTDACMQLYGWERDRQAVTPPADFEHVHQDMKGWAEHLFRQVDTTILKLCPMLANPPSSGRIFFEMDFKAPANIVEVRRELEELACEYDRQAQQARRGHVVSATPAPVFAPLIGGLFGWWIAGRVFREKPLKSECK